MATAMKSWHVTVLKNGLRQIKCLTCVSAQEATLKLAAMKDMYPNVPPDPTSTDPERVKGITYSFFREQF